MGAVTAVSLTQAALAGRTGRGVSIAVIDSGVHPSHPHVRRIVSGVAIDAEGRPGGDVTDRLGHGTAVAAAIHEKAPDAVLVAVKVFDRSLDTTARALVEAIRWAAAARVALINLSLGTARREAESALSVAVADASAAGILIVAAAPDGSTRWLPGALSGVIGVEADWDGPRDTCRLELRPDGTVRARASAFPRPIPGTARPDNLQGVSFAVANATGLVALAVEGAPVPTAADLVRRLGGGPA